MYSNFAEEVSLRGGADGWKWIQRGLFWQITIDHKNFWKIHRVQFIYRPKVDYIINNILKKWLLILQTVNTVILRNCVTVRICLDHETLPLICKLLQKYHDINLMTITDLEVRYWQIPLHPESRSPSKENLLCKINLILSVSLRVQKIKINCINSMEFVPTTVNSPYVTRNF